MNAGPVQFWQVSLQLIESWAVGVEWYLTGLEYQSRGITNYGESDYNPSFRPPQYPNTQAYQDWTLSQNSDYTSLYINLVDKVNEFGQPYNNGIGGVNDPVSGYTFASIEDRILKHAYGLSSLSIKLKENKPAGVTDAQIDTLLSYY